MKTLKKLYESLIKHTNTVKDVRDGMKGKKFPDGETKAVIASTPFSTTKGTLGVQFWTDNQIKAGSVDSADGKSKSTFVEMY